jgi:hypothetical protein
MSIPLVQEATKDAINTSIIAIKRNIERINMLLGLVDSGSPDLSGLATKQELQDAVESLQPVDEVTIDNMQSVTSNAVAESLSYSTTEHKTGGVWIDGKPIYRKVVEFSQEIVLPSNTWVDTPQSSSNIARIINCKGYNNLGACFQVSGARDQGNYMRLLSERPTNTVLIGFMFEYTKTTD